MECAMCGEQTMNISIWWRDTPMCESCDKEAMDDVRDAKVESREVEKPNCPSCKGANIIINRHIILVYLCWNCEYKWHNCQVDGKTYDGVDKSSGYVVCPNCNKEEKPVKDKIESTSTNSQRKRKGRSVFS